jgi:hypothetical protein
MRLSKQNACLFFLLALFACGANNNEPAPADDGKDREVILTNWADNIVVPAYASFKIKFEAVKAKSDAFISVPGGSSLTDLRSAWQEAYLEWEKVELFEFGPADKYTLRNFFNIYPADVAGITANFSDPAANMEVPAAYPRQGFPALDYLINGTGADDNSIVAFYSTNADAAKHRGYLSRVVSRMNDLLTLVTQDWSGSYRTTFISNTGLDISSSMGAVVNAYVLSYERYVRSGKFGIPSGATVATGGMPSAEKVEAYYKRDISLLLAKNAHDAAVSFFKGKSITTGAEGASFQSYLDALGAKDATTGTPLSTIISDEFDVVSARLDALSPNLYDQVNTNNQAMIDTYKEMQKLVRILKVDMTSAMSVTITYTDNDGD